MFNHDNPLQVYESFWKYRETNINQNYEFKEIEAKLTNKLIAIGISILLFFKE